MLHYNRRTLGQIALPLLMIGGAALVLVAASTRAAQTAPQYVPIDTKKAAPSTAAGAKSEVTFARQIAPLIYANCAPCHQEGAVAPFPLRSYADVKKRAKQIAYVTQERIMPPWKADEGKEKFKDARRLSDQEIALIQQWVKNGAPRGDAATEPKPPAPRGAWSGGAPDQTYDTGGDFAVPADSDDIYRCFVVPTNFDSDRYVSMLQVRPGNNRVVHHVIAYLDTSGKARKLDAADPGPGYTSFGGVGFGASGALGGWAPGNEPQLLPAGSGFLLPKGADIVLQVHYHPSGKPETDRTKIGVTFTRGTVDKMVRILPIMGHPLRIPAGEANYKTGGQFPVMFPATILGVMPHMHLLGREMLVEAELPDGSKKKLVNVPDWDFNWQTSYVFKNPIQVPSGTRLKMTARFDNSTDNPNNPNSPPREVTWGEETKDEMCIAFVIFTLDNEHLAPKAAAASTRTPSGG